MKIKGVVIADDHYNGLGMIRSLGLLNIDVSLILLTKEKTFIDSSKYVNYCIKINHKKEELLEALREIIEGNKDSTIILYPVNDFSAQILDSEYKSFPSNVFCPNANGNMYHLSDKQIAKKIAEECGICVPSGLVIDILEAYNKLPNINYPVIVKPLISIEGAKCHIKTAYDHEQFFIIVEEYMRLGYKRALVEEYINGKDSYMLEVMGARNSNGNIEYAGIIKKHREYPIINGSTSYATIIQKHSGIDFEKMTRFLNRIEYVGLFDFEFKHSKGQTYFIECNYRNGAPAFVFTKNGYNIAGVWAEKEIGVDMNVKHDKINNINFMIEQNDIINMLKGNESFFKWIKEYFCSCKVFYIKGDKKPVFLYYMYFLKHTIKSYLSKKAFR